MVPVAVKVKRSMDYYGEGELYFGFEVGEQPVYVIVPVFADR
ncbi:hypothetical protein ES703_92447 [subsurface metagenome]